MQPQQSAAVLPLRCRCVAALSLRLYGKCGRGQARVNRAIRRCLRQSSELQAKRKMENEGILKDLAASSADQAAKQRECPANFLRRLKLSSRCCLEPLQICREMA